MTRRNPDSEWLIGLEAIADYAEFSTRVVNQALLRGEMDGRRRMENSPWRTKREWVDAWIDGFGSVAS